MPQSARLVALLRGVNVGGRKLPMDALRSGLVAAGCTDVVTYIQSGNAVLVPPTGAGRAPRAWLEDVVSGVAGYDVSLVVRTAGELRHTVERNPFPAAEGTKLHVVFYDQAPTFLDDLDAAAYSPEAFVRDGRDVYLSLPGGMGKAQLPIAIERATRRTRGHAPGTARNWTTVNKLAALAAN